MAGQQERQRGGITRRQVLEGLGLATATGALYLVVQGLESWLASIPTPSANPTPIPGDVLPYQSVYTIRPDQLPRYTGKRVRIAVSSQTPVTEPQACQLTDTTTRRSHPVLETQIGPVEGIFSAGEPLQPETVYRALQSAAYVEGTVLPADKFSLTEKGETRQLGPFLNVTTIAPKTQTL